MSQTLSASEMERYDRHVVLSQIGIQGQLRIKQAKVLVVGAGGLGSPVLRYLAAAGVGTLGIVDNDVVSESNLQRQILYDTNDLGMAKAVVAERKLRALNPHVAFQVYIELLSEANALDIARGWDMVVDCTDNYPARYVLNTVTRQLGIPMVHAAIFKFQGQVSVFNYQGGPPYTLLYPTPPPVNRAPDAKGLLGVLPGVVGSLQANEVLKIILGTGTVLSGKLLLIDLLQNQFELLDF